MVDGVGRNWIKKCSDGANHVSLYLDIRALPFQCLVIIISVLTRKELIGNWNIFRIKRKKREWIWLIADWPGSKTESVGETLVESVHVAADASVVLRRRSSAVFWSTHFCFSSRFRQRVHTSRLLCSRQLPPFTYGSGQPT